MLHAGRALALSESRERIGRLEYCGRSRKALPFGAVPLIVISPVAGLSQRASRGHGDGGCQPACGRGDAVRCWDPARTVPRFCGASRRRDLFAPALAAVGLHPDRVIYAETHPKSEVLPPPKRGFATRVRGCGRRSRAAGLTVSRRLRASCRGVARPALILRRWRNACERASTPRPRRRNPLAGFCCPVHPLPVPGVGRERWLVELVRCKGAEPRSGCWSP